METARETGKRVSLAKEKRERAGHQWRELTAAKHFRSPSRWLRAVARDHQDRGRRGRRAPSAKGVRKGERAKRNETKRNEKGGVRSKNSRWGATSRTRGAIKLSIRKAAINNDKEGMRTGEAEVENPLLRETPNVSEGLIPPSDYAFPFLAIYRKTIEGKISLPEKYKG